MPPISSRWRRVPIEHGEHRAQHHHADGQYPDQRGDGVGLDADLASMRFDGIIITDRKFQEPRKRLRRGSGEVRAEGDFAKQTRPPHSAGLLV
jgi:hypothetical protein